MNLLVIISQMVIALGIYNVWLLRTGKATSWRGGEAKTMAEEFAVYGLPAWAKNVVGFFKLLLATLLLAGIWFPVLTKPAAFGMTLLMLGAVSMHIKVRDPLLKSLPALALLALSLLILLA